MYKYTERADKQQHVAALASSKAIHVPSSLKLASYVLTRHTSCRFEQTHQSRILHDRFDCSQVGLRGSHNAQHHSGVGCVEVMFCTGHSELRDIVWLLFVAQIISCQYQAWQVDKVERRHILAHNLDAHLLVRGNADDLEGLHGCLHFLRASCALLTST